MKVVVWENQWDVLDISNVVFAGDEAIEIPDALYEKFMGNVKEFNKIQTQIREFQREQERSRAYLDS